MTAEELLRLNLPNKRTELVRGVLVVREPAGYQHGDVAMRLAAAIFAHVEAHGLGRVFAAETGFTLARNPTPCELRTSRSSVQPVFRSHHLAASPSWRPISPWRFCHRMTGRVRC